MPLKIIIGWQTSIKKDKSHMSRYYRGILSGHLKRMMQRYKSVNMSAEWLQALMELGRPTLAKMNLLIKKASLAQAYSFKWKKIKYYHYVVLKFMQRLILKGVFRLFMIYRLMMMRRKIKVRLKFKVKVMIIVKVKVNLKVKTKLNLNLN